MDNILLVSQSSPQHFKLLGDILRGAEKIRAEVIIGLMVGAQVIVSVVVGAQMVGGNMA